MGVAQHIAYLIFSTPKHCLYKIVIYVSGYIEFWFDSIHCHRTTDELKDEPLDPPLFLVFTGKDKFDNEVI